MMRVAEVDQHVGPVAQVTDRALRVDGLLAAGDGFGVLAQLVVGIAEGVECGGLGWPVPELAVYRERLRAGADGVPVTAELCLAPADRVEGIGLPGPVPGGLVQPQRFLRVAERRKAAALYFLHPAEVDMRPRLSDPAAELAAELKDRGQVRAGLGVGAEADLGLGHVLACLCLPSRVTQPLRRRQRQLLDRRQLVPVPSPVEEHCRCPGELPGACVEPAGCGQPDQAEQYLELGLEPVQRLLAAG